MPYNNAAIPPPEEITGQTSLPRGYPSWTSQILCACSLMILWVAVARVKRIIHVDDDINNCSSGAAFAIALATEMFVRYLVEQGHNVVKSERKPRRNIQYKDLATAVTRIDNLEFLADVIPRTIPYRQYAERKSKEAASTETTEPGQTTLDGNKVGEGLLRTSTPDP
ncbi:MAG: hypothetical protein M1833_000869 [Piccolia ochrophora]|nr:MAG: hypothetical protein M1833_000869 [Piccolia ochrophora]